ncbi:MAG: hypothetical protein HKN47_16830, partial [Pirellulaceae bacterium]|nr:hypothetical protein [Pirellulaceae bacterium]
MLEITPPPTMQQVAVGSSQVDSEAITEDAIDAEASEAVASDVTPSGFTSDGSIADPVASSDALGGPMPPSWQSERTQRSRQIGLVVALTAAGLLGSVLLFGWFVKNWRDGRAAVSQDDTTAVGSPEVIDAASQEPADPDPDESPDTVADSPGASELAPTDVVDPARDETAISPDVTPSTDTATEVTSADPAPDTPTDVEMNPPTSVPADLIPSSPLDMLPPGMADSSSGTPADSDAEADGPKELPEDVQKLLSVFDLGGDQKPPALATPATLDEIEIARAAEENIDPMLVANPPEPINFKRALTIKVALSPTNNDSYPLSDLILLISQMSGVPIQIDWVSFDLVGVNIRDGVSGLKGTGWLTLGDLLDQVANTVDGTIIQDETMMRFEPSETALASRLDELFDLSDFGEGQTSATATLNLFLAGSERANAKTLQVGPERKDQQLAALAVEAMRRMRGVTPKVDDSILRRWAQSASDPRRDWPLASGRASAEPLRSPLAAAGFLRHIASMNDATCFVNWFDA